MPSSKSLVAERQFSYTSEDFQWPSRSDESQFEPSNFDKKFRGTWDAAMDAGYFTYNLDRVEGRVAPGRYSLYIQLNEQRFTKRRKPHPFDSVSQPFDPEKFNFTKVQSKEALCELRPKHRTSSATSSDDHHVIILNTSPMEYGHSLLVPRVNSCFPQILTEEAILLGLETALLSNHRGFRLGFNSLCAYSSVNHLHFHVWYQDAPSYLQTVNMNPVCEDLFEVKDYATNTFVFELGPQTDVSLLARKIHLVSSYLINNEIAHTCHVMRGTKCSSKTKENDSSVIRVFLWPRNSVTGSDVRSSYADSDDRPMAVFEFGGFVAVETRDIFNSFTEEKFCEHMRRASLPQEEFERHRKAVVNLFHRHTFV